jgi:PEP-CTERM motif
MKLGIAYLLLLASAAGARAEGEVTDETLPAVAPASAVSTVDREARSGSREVPPVVGLPESAGKLATKPAGGGSAIPEPATTLVIFGVGLILLFRRRSAS